MKIFYSYKQLSVPEGNTLEYKKAVFKRLYLSAFKTVWPYLGGLFIFLWAAIVNTFLTDYDYLIKSL